MQAESLSSLQQPSNPDQAQSQQRLYQCSTCKRSFSRADHLTRHVRAHTKSKPYVCPICTKGFARIDLLKRHVSNHDSDSARKRQRREIARDARVIQACEACSSSHLRCEDEKPCTRCKKKNIPCRVPDSANPNDNDINELDVHAAQDLLDFSSGFEYPPEMTKNEHSVGAPSEQPSHNNHNFMPPSHPPADAFDIASGGAAVADMLNPSNRASGSNDATELSSLGQQYGNESTVSLNFFNNMMASYDETPGSLPDLPDYFRNMPPFEALLSGHATPRGIMDLSFDLDVGLTDIDLGLLDQYNFQIPFAADTPSTDAHQPDQQFPETSSVPVRTEAFKQSVWRFLPQSNKDFGSAEQANLAFTDSERDRNRHVSITQRRVIAEKLHRVSRDRLMAMVLGTCSPENVKRISSAFPTMELLDGLVQFFFTTPAFQAQSWIHVTTFSPSKIIPELLGHIVSAGAISTPDMALRKLGFALHEAARASLAHGFEQDNSSIRSVMHLCSLYLQLKIGMWSGISRKMEISESFLQPLITMVRRGSRFRQSTWKEISPSPEDHGATLEEKWHAWVQQESYLRLVYRCFELDRHQSMALLKPPLISYSEMQLPLPSSDYLWQAKSPALWKQAYLERMRTAKKRPSAIDCFLDLEHLAQHDHASMTYLYMMWGMVWEYQQMVTLTDRPQEKSNNSLILSSRHQELTKQFDDFRVSSLPLSKSTEMLLEFMLLHVNAPLEKLQLFAGIEGQEEARAAYPILREWVKKLSARQALWHAGQILRAAEGLSSGSLCNFNAIIIYHAGLVLWGYGFLKRTPTDGSPIARQQQTTVILNGTDSLNARRFTTLDRGVPSIQDNKLQNLIQISSIPEIMNVLIRLLRGPNEAIESPPLNANLIQLLEGLRSA